MGRKIGIVLDSNTNTSLKALFGGISSMLNTIRLQNADHKNDIGDIIEMCDEAIQKQSFAKLSYKMKDLSVGIEQEFFDNRILMQNKYQGFIRDILSKNKEMYTPTQSGLIKKLEKLAENKKVDQSEIFEALSELSLDMSVSMSAYRKESYGEKEIGNNEFTRGVETVLAADVATAGKRISRDLERLARQLKDTGSTDPEAIKILNDIEDAQKGEVKFYESIDLLSKVTWLLYRLNDRNINREKEYLVNISSQFSEISKSCIESLKISDESQEELKDFDTGFLKEIEAISKSSKNAESLDDLKIAIAQHVEKMQDKLSRHMLSQSTKIVKQKGIIEEQVSKINKLNNKVLEQKGEINDISAESELDQLTRINNRRSYDKYITEMQKSYSQKGGELGIMLIDIDHFKKINDTYGHASGDIVLAEFAKILNRVVKQVDGLFAARYGGEEFVLVGRNMNKAKFKNIGRKIREYIEKKSFKISSNKSIKYTVSIGISYFNKKGDLTDYVFRLADKALYKAKDSGRNQLWISNNTVLVKSEGSKSIE